MMKNLQFVLITLAVLLSSCSSSLSEATTYAMKACKVEKDSSGQYQTELADSSGVWSIDDPINDIRKNADALKKNAIDASAAGQLDSSYRPLADAIGLLSSKLNQVLRQREEMKRLNNYYYPDFDWSFLDNYNQILDTVRNECLGLVNRIN